MSPEMQGSPWVAGDLRGVNCRAVTRFDQLEDMLHHRLHVEAGAVEDDRVLRGAKRGDGPGGIRLVARPDLSEQLVLIHRDTP